MKLKSHVRKIIMTALAVAILSPALVFASGPARSARQSGLIKAVDMNTHTLVVSEPKSKEQTFQWNDQTKFREHFRSTTASALKEGEHVRVAYAPGGATPVLKRVYITPVKHTAKNSASTSKSS
jgi:hypothetical protein